MTLLKRRIITLIVTIIFCLLFFFNSFLSILVLTQYTMNSILRGSSLFKFFFFLFGYVFFSILFVVTLSIIMKERGKTYDYIKKKILK